jgi:Zn ribbon nucleic-acid-binding protein
MIKAIKRLWAIATCDHVNYIVSLKFEDSTEVRICQKCGRVVDVMDEGDSKHNNHKRLNYGL